MIYIIISLRNAFDFWYLTFTIYICIYNIEYMTYKNYI